MPDSSRMSRMSRSMKQFGRWARGLEGLDPTPRKIRVDRETRKILDCDSTLLDWPQQNLKGKGPERGTEIELEIIPDQISTLQWLVAYAFYKHPFALKESDGGTTLQTDDIKALGRLAAHPYHEYLFGSTFRDEGTQRGDSKSRDAALTQLTRIAQELQAWDLYRRGQTDQPPPIIREVARRERIENLLRGLPKNRPSVLDLPPELRWQLYIDKPDHGGAARNSPSNPGALYDKRSGEFERLPGNQESMELLIRVLAEKKRQNLMNSKMDSDTYTQVTNRGTGVRDKRLARRSAHRSIPSIKSAIQEGDRFCGRGSHRSGRWCATNPWQ